MGLVSEAVGEGFICQDVVAGALPSSVARRAGARVPGSASVLPGMEGSRRRDPLLAPGLSELFTSEALAKCPEGRQRKGLWWAGVGESLEGSVHSLADCLQPSVGGCVLCEEPHSSLL